MSKKPLKRAPRKSAPARRQSPVMFAGIWIASFLSAALLYVAAKAVIADFGSFRSCDSNNTMLSISNCGKNSINVGDLILVALFILVAALAASLFTHAWRITRRPQ